MYGGHLRPRARFDVLDGVTRPPRLIPQPAGARVQRNHVDLRIPLRRKKLTIDHVVPEQPIHSSERFVTLSISHDDLVASCAISPPNETTPPRAIELFAEARERCPVAHSDKQGGFRLLLNYDDVKSVSGRLEDLRVVTEREPDRSPNGPRSHRSSRTRRSTTRGANCSAGY